MRINGAVCSKEDLLSLNPKVIKSIDFIDNPGVRYGKDIAYVINIKTRKDEDGYTLGVDLMNTVSTWNGEDMAFAKWNHAILNGPLPMTSTIRTLEVTVIRS
ncbi:hypothetical protein [Segatella albensis]|uniref:hypothetical protein n=1 Tax=Segatella albensis TaxID=77768 RepID=UPI000AE8EC54|nr:hypothetical protein [Segatella albensis]